MYIIAIAGKYHSGKDTIADYLVNNYGYTKIAFADPLKEACKNLFNFTNEQLFVNKEQTDSYWQISPRTAMQIVGTDLLRTELSKVFPHIGENIFVMNMEKRINDLYKSNPNICIVISDLRFYNEYLMLQSFKDAVFVNIVREENNEIKSISNIKANKEKIINNTLDLNRNHSSENDITNYDIKYDYLILNKGTINDLYIKVDTILDN